MLEGVVGAHPAVVAGCPAAIGEAVLGEGGWVGLLPDQNAKERGVTVNFLGKPASFFKGPALLQIATGAPNAFNPAAIPRPIWDPRPSRFPHVQISRAKVYAKWAAAWNA